MRFRRNCSALCLPAIVSAFFVSYFYYPLSTGYKAHIFLIYIEFSIFLASFPLMVNRTLSYRNSFFRQKSLTVGLDDGIFIKTFNSHGINMKSIDKHLPVPLEKNRRFFLQPVANGKTSIDQKISAFPFFFFSLLFDASRRMCRSYSN